MNLVKLLSRAVLLSLLLTVMAQAGQIDYSGKKLGLVVTSHSGEQSHSSFVDSLKAALHANSNALELRELTPSQLKLKSSIRSTKDEQFYLRIPKTGSYIRDDSDYSPDIVILLEDLAVTDSSISFVFAIWDNEQRDLLTFGRTATETAQDQFDWLALQILGSEGAEENSATHRPFSARVVLLGALSAHLKDKPANNQNIPDQFEDLRERPSVSQYFAAGKAFGVVLDLSIPLKGDQGDITIGAEFSQESAQKSAQQPAIIVLNGAQLTKQELVSRSWTLSVGYIQGISPRVYTFGKCRLSFRSYEGNFEWDEIQAKLAVKRAIAPGINAGIIAFVTSSIGLMLEAGFDISSVRATGLTAQGVTTPATFKLSDNRIFIRAGLTYNITF